MIYNESIWAAYEPGYVHPDFIPYMNTPVKDDVGNTVYVNTWNRTDTTNTGMVNSNLIRKDWGMAFQLAHADDPAPVGWRKTLDGWCVKQEPENDAIFYTDRAFVPKRQYWETTYATRPEPRRVSESTDMRSVNPFTGRYSVYYLPKGESMKYSRNSTKDSYWV